MTTSSPLGTSARPRQDFPPEVRLRKRREYRTVYERGVHAGGRHLVVFLQGNDLGRARLGVTATRKVGGAAQRNRLKRVVREVFRRHRYRLGSWDLVVNVRARAVGRPYEELEAEMLDQIERAARRLAAQDRRRSG
jgi:ribonuclease P protein component